MSSRVFLQRFSVSSIVLAVAIASPSLFAQSSSSADYAAQSSSAFQLPATLQYRTQYQNQYPSGGGGYHQYKGGDSSFSHIAVEAGVGVGIPVGSSTDSNKTGYSFLVGGGYNFNKRLGLMAEYRFDDLGIQDSVLNQIAAAAAAAGVDLSNGLSGNTHAWSLTLDPVYNIRTKGHFGGYVTGGGGFYRLLTSFNTPVFEGYYYDYYYGYVPDYANQTVSHYSSNQGGFNLGGGVTWKPNPDQHGAIFADVRYEWLDSPGNATQILPITFGYRW
jgi:hypothetical protein